MKTPSSARPKLLVFTDLDGTLLDHADYGYDAAKPALAALKARVVPLVLASSKTAAEIAPLHRELGLGETPAIVENGAGVFRPGGLSANAAAYAQLRLALDGLTEDLRHGFRGFGDMAAREVAERTWLSLDSAKRAKTRQFSEPGIWCGDDQRLAAFCTALAQAGITAVQGGRFLTLSFGAGKADRMAEIAAAFGAPTTLALGDAPNDIGLLEAADFGVIVRNDHGSGIPHLAGEESGRIARTTMSGPAGWNAAVLDFLATQLDEGATQSHG